MNEMRKLMEAVGEYRTFGIPDYENIIELENLAHDLELAYKSFFAKANEVNPKTAKVMNQAAEEMFDQMMRVVEYR